MIEDQDLRTTALSLALERHADCDAHHVVKRAEEFHKFLTGKQESASDALQANGAIIAEWLKHWPGNRS